MSSEAERFGPGGAALWHAYTDTLELETGELAALRLAAHAVDELEVIERVLAKSQPTVKGSTGQLRGLGCRHALRDGYRRGVRRHPSQLGADRRGGGHHPRHC